MHERVTTHKYLYVANNPVLLVDPSVEMFRLGKLNVGFNNSGYNKNSFDKSSDFDT